jgi:glucose/arabinose dehydrogenase
MVSIRTCGALLLAVALTACGGGSGGGSDGGGGAPPASVTLTAPADLASGLTGTLAITATAGAGVAAVEFEVDGQPVGEDSSAPYAASVDTALYASGQHVVRARARDAAGNRSAWDSATVRFGTDAGAPAGITRNEAWVTGLSGATAFAQAPDGRIFVCEQRGTLRVIKNGQLLPTPFHTFPDIDDTGERGLLGVALHPGFATNRLVYVYRTTTQNGTHNRIGRLVANGDVSTGVETPIVDLPALSDRTNHNGGAIHFGPDGKLYAGVGDNANGAKAPDLADLFGKILRFNDDGTVPGDNPFCTTGEPRCAIWARGLRNPFTFAFQPGSGRMHINDVGQAAWEEIDLGAAGANYGWPASEGPDNIGAGVNAPLFAYRHAAATPPGSGPGGFFTGLAIAGGAFYPAGGSLPAAYHGSYFFADFLNGWIGRLDLANDNAAYAFGQVGGSPVDLLVADDGALLVLTRSGITRFSAP